MPQPNKKYDFEAFEMCACETSMLLPSRGKWWYNKTQKSCIC